MGWKDVYRGTGSNLLSRVIYLTSKGRELLERMEATGELKPREWARPDEQRRRRNAR